MSAIPKYSTKSQFGLAALKVAQNDIDIYVEDEASWRLTLKLVQQNLPRGVKIKNVFPLGGRTAVLEAAGNAPKNPKRKELYVYDPDLELISKLKIMSPKHAVPHSRYCTENHFFYKKSAITAVTADCARLRDQEIENQLEFSDVRKQATLFLRLYTVYAIAARLGYRGSTASYRIERLCLRQGTRLVPSRRLIAGRSRELFAKLRAKYGDSKVRDAMRVVAVRLGELDDPLAAVSGKDVLVPLLFSAARSRLRIGGSKEAFCIRLGEATETVRCRTFSRRLARTLRSL